LARFGAEVILVSDPRPASDPRVLVQFGLLAHRGKKTILADLKSTGGKEILVRLAKWADIIIFNGTETQKAPLGLEFAHLQSLNPNLICCLLEAYGGPRVGPRSDHVAYDDVLQASLGIMARFGEPGQPTEHAHIGVIDVVAGWGGAFACACALFRRKRYGIGGVCATSLAAAGQYLQIPFAYDHPDRVFDEPSGKTRKAHSLHGCFECSDGWLFVAATSADAKPCVIEAAQAHLAAAGIESLEYFCRLKTRVAARDALKKVNVSAAPVGNLVERRDNGDNLKASSSFRFDEFLDHPCGLRLVHPAQCAVRAEAPQKALGTSRKLGIDTRAVLEEMGLGQQIEHWLSEGHIAESVADIFIPE